MTSVIAYVGQGLSRDDGRRRESDRAPRHQTLSRGASLRSRAMLGGEERVDREHDEQTGSVPERCGAHRKFSFSSRRRPAQTTCLWHLRRTSSRPTTQFAATSAAKERFLHLPKVTKVGRSVGRSLYFVSPMPVKPIAITDASNAADDEP